MYAHCYSRSYDSLDRKELHVCHLAQSITETICTLHLLKLFTKSLKDTQNIQKPDLSATEISIQKAENRGISSMAQTTTEACEPAE